MIQRVLERAKLVRGVDQIVVATDDERIERAVRAFGGEVMMTSPELPSGTDRVAAVADRTQGDVYVNIQGDEPLLDPRAVEKALELVTSGRFTLATAMTPLKSAEELQNPAVVKVVTDKSGRALYFTRFPIPYSRSAADPATGFASFRHVGLYVYTRETLFRLRSLPPSPLEKAESLEQLRAMEDGIPIGVAQVDFVSIGVDTPEELEKVRRILV